MTSRWGELDEDPFPPTVLEENQLSEEEFRMHFMVEFRMSASSPAKINIVHGKFLLPLAFFSTLSLNDSSYISAQIPPQKAGLR